MNGVAGSGKQGHGATTARLLSLNVTAMIATKSLFNLSSTAISRAVEAAATEILSRSEARAARKDK
jgi:hypothetical protein